MSRKKKRGVPLPKGWARLLTTKLAMVRAKPKKAGAVVMVARVR